MKFIDTPAFEAQRRDFLRHTGLALAAQVSGVLSTLTFRNAGP